MEGELTCRNANLRYTMTTRQSLKIAITKSFPRFLVRKYTGTESLVYDMNGIQNYTANAQGGYGYDSVAKRPQNTLTTEVYLQNSSANFGDNVDVRGELILIPNQRLNNLPVIASQLIDSRRNQAGTTRNPPVLQGGLPRSIFSKRIVLYCSVISLFTILVVTIAAILLQDDGIGDFVTRKQWNALPPACEVESLNIVPKLVVIQHTVTEECTEFEDCVRQMRYMQQKHINLDYCEVGYNFIVGGDGRVYEGRGYKKVGSHTRFFNNKTLGVALIGDFSAVHPNDKHTRRTLDFLEQTMKLGYLTKDFKICGAYQLGPTNSPGQKLIEDMKHWERYTDNPKWWLKPKPTAEGNHTITL